MSKDTEEQFKTLRLIRAHAHAMKHPKMGDSADLAWAIRMCGDIADYFIRVYEIK